MQAIPASMGIEEILALVEREKGEERRIIERLLEFVQATHKDAGTILNLADTLRTGRWSPGLIAFARRTLDQIDAERC